MQEIASFNTNLAFSQKLKYLILVTVNQIEHVLTFGMRNIMVKTVLSSS